MTTPVPRDFRTKARPLAAILMPIGPAAVAVFRFILPYGPPHDGHLSCPRSRPTPSSPNPCPCPG